ncbi:MAG: four helix bundle protein [Patescibacteria group bacterium]
MIHKLYEFYKLVHQDSNKFPKTERHALGEALKSRALALIEGAWEANALPLPERILLLDRLQRTLDLMKILVRLVYDLGIYQLKGYLYREERLQEIGRMLGGWRRQTRKRLGLDP